MAEPILTSARQAVWQAIETWPALSGAFTRRYKFEDLPGRLPGPPTPTAGDLPALAIYPDTAQTTWALHQSQEVRYPLRVDFWTREWDVRAGERLWEEIIKSLYQNLPTGSTAGRRLVHFSPLSPKIVALGEKNAGPRATRWTFIVELSAGFWNPKTAG